MSTRKRRTRDPLDRYYTPNYVVEQAMDIVLPAVVPRPPQGILDPGAGDGAFLRQLARKYPKSWIVGADIDPDVGPWDECANESYEADFLVSDWPQVFGDVRIDLVIGNPPYGRAMEFIEAALEITDTVVYLLRVDFLCSAGRAEFFLEHKPSHVFLLPNRPPFTGPALRPPYTEEPKDGQTGEYDYAWICWSPMHVDQVTQLDWLPVVDRQIRRPTAKAEE